MRSILDVIENRWLGFAKAILLGSPRDQGRSDKIGEAIEGLIKDEKLELSEPQVRDLKKLEFSTASSSNIFVTFQRALLFSLFDAAHILEDEQISAGIFAHVCQRKVTVKAILERVREFGNNNKPPKDERYGATYHDLNQKALELPFQH